MRAKELFNKLTLGNKLIVVGMAISLCNTAYANELATFATSLTDAQFQAQRCDGATSNWRTSEKDFALACADAGLGSVSSCTSKLEKCDSSDNKYSYCIGSATSRDDYKDDEREKKDEERELQERKETLLADYQEKQTEIQRAKEEQDLVQQELQSTLAGIDNAKAQKQLELETSLQAIADQTANTRDEIDKAQLKLREFVVNNELKCRETALEEKNKYILATRGKQLTVNQLFGRTGLSVNQAGSIRYEQVVRNCKALYTDTGKSTGFGSQYRLQHKNIELQKSILKRQIARYETQKQQVIRNTRQALAVMDEQKQTAMINAQTASLRATQNVQLLQTQRNDIMAQINQLDGKMNILGREVSTAQVMATVELGKSIVSGRQAAGEDEVKVAKQDKIDAFNKAVGLKDMIDNAEDDKHKVCKTERDRDETAANLAAVDINGSADETTAVATEIKVTGRTPAASAGETL